MATSMGPAGVLALAGPRHARLQASRCVLGQMKQMIMCGTARLESNEPKATKISEHQCCIIRPLERDDLTLQERVLLQACWRNCYASNVVVI